VSGKPTEKDYNRGKCSNDRGVSTFMHDIVDNRNRETTQYSWQGAHSPVWDVVCCVTISDVCELEVALKTDEPSRKSEQQLREWGMNIEIVLATQIICGELAKMNLIETVAPKKKLTARVLRRRKGEAYTTWSG
jgi:hypothetical protein